MSLNFRLWPVIGNIGDTVDIHGQGHILFCKSTKMRHEILLWCDVCAQSFSFSSKDFLFLFGSERYRKLFPLTEKALIVVWVLYDAFCDITGKLVLHWNHSLGIRLTWEIKLISLLSRVNISDCAHVIWWSRLRNLRYLTCFIHVHLKLY